MPKSKYIDDGTLRTVASFSAPSDRAQVDWLGVNVRRLEGSGSRTGRAPSIKLTGSGAVSRAIMRGKRKRKIEKNRKRARYESLEQKNPKAR